MMPDKPGPNPEDLAVILSDLNMLRGPGGCERTEGEYRELLRQSDFRVTRVLPAGRVSIVETVVA
jgi:hypothetical protein